MKQYIWIIFLNCVEDAVQKRLRLTETIIGKIKNLYESLIPYWFNYCDCLFTIDSIPIQIELS